MPKFEIKIRPFGNRAILVEWPNKIDDVILDDIIHFTSLILDFENDDLINHTPGYNSLLLQYASDIDFENKESTLITIYNSSVEKNERIPSTWHIPVCYEEEFGIDLRLFIDRGLSKREIIQLHTSIPFRVYMIGFLPGFLYLGGLPKELHMNRKEKPRLHVPKGSVAVGGEQTGIYPMASPGGWQILGRTPLSLFDLSYQEPTPIKQGDYIQFYPIKLETYQNLNSH